MKFSIAILTLCCSFNLFAQDSSYKSKGYDKEIFLYQMNTVTNEKINKATYLQYSKPFSKWDPRPLNDSIVWVMNERQTASIIPNFFWGSFSNYYGVKLKKAKALPNDFLKKAYTQEKAQSDYFAKNEAAYTELAELLSKSEHTVFTVQKELRRVDDLYFENDKYWKYEITADSPFPMSDSLNTSLDEKFSEDDEAILQIIEKLNIYSVYNDPNTIFFLLDGVLDNSYGFAYQKNETDINSNHLFDISRKTFIKSKFYYYVAR